MFRSFADIDKSDAKPHTNQNNSWLVSRHFVDGLPFEYLNAQHRSVLVGQAGVIRFVPFLNENSLKAGRHVETLSDVPNYIGDNVSDKMNAGVKYEIEVEGKNTVRFEAIADACPQSEGNYIRLGSHRFPVATKVGQATIVGNFRMEIETTQDICYVVLKEFSVTRALD